jgi:hypothetical protein
MISQNGLDGWLGDAAAQAATMKRAEEVGRACRALPELVELERELEQASPHRAGEILAIAQRFLTRPSWIDDCLLLAVRGANADFYFRPALRNASPGLVSGLWLFDRPLLSLFLAVVPIDALAAKKAGRSGAASITFTGQRSLYWFAKAGGATLAFWDSSPIGPGFTAGGAERCRLIERRRIKDGETIEIDGRRHGFVIEHAESDIVFVQAITPVGAAPLMVEYDAETLRFVGASSTDEASSRTQLMLSLLRTMKRTDATPLFEQMLESPHFYARWQAMREFLALDPDAALPHLERMAEADPHPEVRAAAGETLRSFFADAEGENDSCPA